jgi:glycosyltransferase involved in cell wall biosynthesis
VPFIELGKGGRWDVLRFLLRLRRAIRNAGPDVLYSFVGSANLFAALVHPSISPTKLVWSIRSSDMDLGRYDWAHRFAYGFERRLSRFADLIISNSHAGVEFAVANGFPRHRIAVVPNGIDTARFRIDPSLRKAQRAKWGISDIGLVVGMLARFDPMKGHTDFLRAAAHVAKVREDVTFVCVGGGPEEHDLKQLADELAISDRLLFPGPTPDPVAALNGVDLFCSASVWGEGFSNAIAEAMACGVPCVVTDVGDSAAIAANCGLVVPPSNPQRLAKAILEQLDAFDQDNSAQGRARIVENFSIDAMVHRTLSLLWQVVVRQDRMTN